MNMGRASQKTPSVTADNSAENQCENGFENGSIDLVEAVVVRIIKVS